MVVGGAGQQPFAVAGGETSPEGKDCAGFAALRGAGRNWASPVGDVTARRDPGMNGYQGGAGKVFRVAQCAEVAR